MTPDVVSRVTRVLVPSDRHVARSTPLAEHLAGRGDLLLEFLDLSM
jgi:hypothetical protein